LVAAQFPKLSFGSYPPTARGDHWVKLVVRGDTVEAVQAAIDTLFAILEANDLEPERMP